MPGLGALISSLGIGAGKVVKDSVGPIVDGAVSIFKETSDPKSKISSKKSAASAFIFTAIYISTSVVCPAELSKESLYLITVFSVLGSALLYWSMRDKKEVTEEKSE